MDDHAPGRQIPMTSWRFPPQPAPPAPTRLAGAQNAHTWRPFASPQTHAKTAPSESSLCQEVAVVFLAACGMAFGGCGFTGGRGPGAFPAAEYGRRLAAPPGRSSSLRCGRSAWTCGLAGGGVAAAGECLALPRLRVMVVG